MLRSSTSARLSRRGPVLWLCARLLVGCSGRVDATPDSPTPDPETSPDAAADASVGNTQDAGTPTLDPDRPFEPLRRESALLKVKTFLIGIAPSAAEYAAFRDEQAVLPALIDTWMKRPEFEPRLQQTLALMFQQQAGSDEIGLMLREQNTDIFQQREGRGGVDLEGAMRRSWALTAWELVEQGRPFTEVATTRTYYLNVPLMMAMAYIDATPRDDTNAYVRDHSWLEKAYPDLQVSYTQSEQIPFAESLDPSSAHYGKFTINQPDGSAAGTSACDGLSNTFSGRAAIEEVYKTMLGVPFRTTCWSWNGAMANVFEPSDLEYRPVTLRVAKPGEAHTIFWDLATLRSASEMVLDTEYLGFFGTLGFLTQWTTNDANEHRVTANQTLIVGLGRSFDPGASNVVIDDAANDELHAAPGSVCYGCHVDLDPLRDFFRQSYTYWGSARVAGMGDNETIPDVAYFSVDGSKPVAGFGVADLGAAIANSPRFAPAWTEKICGLVNAGFCDAKDPELIRIAKAFVDSKYDFRTLLRELLSSPVVTYLERTATWETKGPAVGAALQDDFCRRLSNRTQIKDACALEDKLDALRADRDRIAGYAGVLSPIGYPRGAVEPEQPIAGSLFSTAGAESLCEALAVRFVGSGAGVASPALLVAEEREKAIDFLLAELIGSWNGDARAGELRAVLEEHWDAVLSAGETADFALRSTFALACASPQTTSIGL